MSLLPPLTSLRAFDAVVRHLNFTRAGEELGMTQAAVSYQIKILEERFGAPLFLRQPRQLTLTEAGERLAPVVTKAFATLREGYVAARQGTDTVLTISVFMTFAVNWLARRLGSFQVANPGLAVKIDISQDLVDFSRDDVDVGIRSGSGDWPGLVVRKLASTRFTPMLTPALADSIGGIHDPADLLKLPILDAQDSWWPQWFAAAQCPYDAHSARAGGGTQTYAAAGAMAGQGVAILSPAIFAAELSEGKLIQPFDIMADDHRGIYLVHTEGRRNVPKIRAFREWLLAEMAKGA